MNRAGITKTTAVTKRAGDTERMDAHSPWGVGSPLAGL